MNTLLSTRTGVAVARILVLICLLLAWWGSAVTGLLPVAIVPNPVDVLREFGGVIGTGAYWEAVGLTLGGALQGLLAAVIVGIPLGMITGRRRYLDLSTRFLFDFGRAYPAIALLTVLVLLLGTSQQMKSTVVFIAVVFPLIIQTQQGARKIPAGIEEMVRSYKVPGRLVVTKVLLPWVAPYIATGVRLAATVAVLVALGTEVLAGAPGVGRDLGVAQASGNTPLAYTFILTACFLGAGINMVAGYLRDRVITWRPDESGD